MNGSRYLIDICEIGIDTFDIYTELFVICNNMFDTFFDTYGISNVAYLMKYSS